MQNWHPPHIPLRQRHFEICVQAGNGSVLERADKNDRQVDQTAVRLSERSILFCICAAGHGRF